MRYKKQHNLRVCSIYITERVISGLHSADGLTWHDTNTRFPTFKEYYGYYINNLRRCSNDITKRGMLMIHRLDGIKRLDIQTRTY